MKMILRIFSIIAIALVLKNSPNLGGVLQSTCVVLFYIGMMIPKTPGKE